MYIYVTSTNEGSDLYPKHKRVVYMGLDVGEAEKVIGDFTKYQKDKEHFPARPKECSALPKDLERELIQFYMVSSWWYSIERIEIEPPKKKGYTSINHEGNSNGR